MKRIIVISALGALASLAACNDVTDPAPVRPVSVSRPSLDILVGSATDLGTLLGGVRSNAVDVNALGQVAGFSEVPPYGAFHPFLWTQQDGILDLGTLAGENGVSSGINDLGQIVGESNLASRELRPFLWTPSRPGSSSGTMVDLGTLPGATQTEARGINGLGQVVGYAEIAFSGLRAFLWTPDRAGASTGTMTDISGGINTLANAINDLGQVIGFAQFTTPTASLWSAATGIVSLGTLPGTSTSVAFGINNAGQVVGASYDFHYGDEREAHAFLWTPSSPGATTGTMTDLSTVVGFPSTAMHINDLGQVVGFGRDASGAYGFIWSARDGLLRIPLARLTSINDRGQAVGLQFSDNGVYHAASWSIQVVPPDPIAEVQNIETKVQSLINASTLNQGRGNALLAKLNAATAKLNQGNKTAAINLLHAFINQCQAYMSAGTLSAAEGQPLVDAATALIQQLSTTA